MPLAVTHIFGTILLAWLVFKKYPSIKKIADSWLPSHQMVWIAIAAVLPDMDFLYSVPLYMAHIPLPLWLQHGGMLHTPFFVILLAVIAMLFWKCKKQKMAFIFGLLSFGSLVHIILDGVFGGGSEGGIMLLFPFTMQGWGLFLFNKIPIPHLPSFVDAFFALVWVVWLDWKVWNKS